MRAPHLTEEQNALTSATLGRGLLLRGHTREFYGGLAIVTIIGCVIMIRGGTPDRSLGAVEDTPACVEIDQHAPRTIASSPRAAVSTRPATEASR